MKRILSIDGGGIRGAVPARILGWLEQRLGPSAQTWDLIAGTSTGGILAAGLAHTTDGRLPTYSAKQLLGLYVQRGGEIFARKWYDVASLLKVKYPATGIETVLQEYYGATLLSTSLTNVLITAYDIAKGKPKFFKTTKARTCPPEEGENVPLWYAARCTSAAPTYFPSKDGFVDGGIFATDPAMCAYAEARAMWPAEEIFLLSIGTGYRDDLIDPDKAANWGGLRWLSPIIPMLMSSNAANVEYQIRQFLPPERYVRIQAPIAGEVPSSHMDDATATNIKALIDFADRMIVDQASKLDHAVEVCRLT